MMSSASLTVRLQTALTRPYLQQRCQEVTEILQEVNAKDSAFVFRLIVESIFGVPHQEGGTLLTQTQSSFCGGGWGLRSISLAEHYAEFNTLRSFLAPQGPLISLAFRITHDPFQLFQFPIAWLPVKVKNEIEEGTTTPFYAHKIQALGPGKKPVNIMLNAFEYYMFHFAHFLLANLGGSSYLAFMGGGLSWSSVNDVLYPTLLEDLLSAFLPCDSSMPPGPVGAPVAPRGVLSPMAQRLTASPYSPVGAPNLNLSSLMSPILRSPRSAEMHIPLLDGAIPNPMGGAYTSSPLHSGAPGPYLQPQTEINIWSSQVVLQVLLEKWVNQCVPVPPKGNATGSYPSMIPNPPSSQLYNPTWQLGPACLRGHSFHSVMQDPNMMEYLPNWQSYARLQEVYVPSCDHVRIVRMLVKHLHYFSNSIKSHQPSPLDPLRRSVWSMCRKSIYLFLKHLFLHWPLDSSFRLVLETWLSYIQPWRYTVYIPHGHLSSSPGQNSEMESSRMLDRKWITFIRENLLFYSHQFDLLVGRLLRLDLASPKNAQILFRMTKVYSQDNLVPFIEEIEESLGSSHHLQKCFLGGFLGIPATNIPSRAVSPTDALSKGRSSVQDGAVNPHIMLQAMRAHITEMEGPRYHYEALCSRGIVDKVSRLLKMIQKAEQAISAEIFSSTSQGHERSSGLFNSFYSLFTFSSKTKEEEQRMDEMRKSLAHLNMSSTHLCSVFKLTPLLSVSTASSTNYVSPQRGHKATLIGERVASPDQVLTDEGPVLSPLGRMQMMSGMRRLDLRYEGDPDLKPICSYELVFLVRMLYTLSSFINTKYETEIICYFYRKDLLGRIIRVFLQPPETVYEKSAPGGIHRKTAKHLPPRISLRTFANKHVIGLILSSWLILSMFGISLWSVCLKAVFPLVIIYVVVKAFFEPNNRLELKIEKPHVTPGQPGLFSPTENRGF